MTRVLLGRLMVANFVANGGLLWPHCCDTVVLWHYGRLMSPRPGGVCLSGTDSDKPGKWLWISCCGKLWAKVAESTCTWLAFLVVFTWQLPCDVTTKLTDSKVTMSEPFDSYTYRWGCVDILELSLLFALKNLPEKPGSRFSEVLRKSFEQVQLEVRKWDHIFWLLFLTEIFQNNVEDWYPLMQKAFTIINLQMFCCHFHHS